MDPVMHGFRKTCIQEYMDPGLHGSRNNMDPGIHGSSNKWIQESWIQEYMDCRNTWIQDYMDPGIYGFRKECIQEYMDPGIMDPVINGSAGINGSRNIWIQE